MTGRELLRLHLEAGWSITLPALDPPAQDFVVTRGDPAWSLYLAKLAHEQVAIWRPEPEPEQRARLRAQAGTVEVAWDRTVRMRREMVFHYPHITSQQEERARQRARVLTADDVARIDVFEAGSASYFLHPHRAPCIGVVADGQLMTIAHSSRRTAQACELGINTLPEARRRGYGAAATILWTALIQRQGLVPIYSAFAWNTASLRLAQSIGYTPCIAGVYGPVSEAAG